MTNPFKYRPAEPVDSDDGIPDEWADNWLSNSMAWMSQQWPFEPACNTPEHWTSRLTAYLWTDCPCCLLIRGVVLGVFTIIALEILAGAMYALMTPLWQ